MKGYKCQSCGAYWPENTTGRVFCCDQQSPVQTDAPIPARDRLPARPPLPFVADRLAICQACDQGENGQYCKELKRRTGKLGALMHPDGIPRVAARCPLGKWGWPITVCPEREDFAIITTHFNPFGFTRLRDTYLQWLPTLGEAAKHLVTMELVFDDDAPELNGSTVVRGSRDRHWLWQKEALINRAISDLPERVKYVAWVDHDLIFANKNWILDSLEMLSSGALAVQCFERFQYMNENYKVEKTLPGVVYGGTQPGGAWFAKRSFLNTIGGLLDNNIVGGGDQAFAAVVSGRDRYLDRHRAEFKENNRKWINTARLVANGAKWGFARGDVYHLFHGEFKDRQYRSRDQILIDSRFDPDSMIRTNADGLLEWTDAAPEKLKTNVRAFFENRREDG